MVLIVYTQFLQFSLYFHNNGGFDRSQKDILELLDLREVAIEFDENEFNDREQVFGIYLWECIL
jgi:hypothetical protein